MPQSFYASQSDQSEPGQHREALLRLVDKPEDIARWIASFLQHPRGAESKLNGFSAEQLADLELRSVAEILDVASKRGLLQGEGAAPKVGGVCRDFAIIGVSCFRAASIPARLRVGFADYIVPGCWEDHWLCEWHDGVRWKKFDVEFAAGAELDFDASDVPSARFLAAGEAWRRVRQNPEQATLFGVSSLDLQGEWFVAGSAFREMAALRKLELKPWDYWGLSAELPWILSNWPEQAAATIDKLAMQLGDAVLCDFDALADWPLPEQVISYPRGEPLIVALPTPPDATIR